MKDSTAAEISELQATIDALDGTTTQVVAQVGVPKRAVRTMRSRKLRLTVQDLGRPDGLRHAVLTLVNDELYARANTRIKDFEASKESFPDFEHRAGRYLSYSHDLINAIKAKRSFPNMQNLSVTKQQELYDRAMEHVGELVATLRRIEQIDQECRAEDRRASILPVKALFYSLFAIMALILFIEVSNGLLPALVAVFDDLANTATEKIFKLLSL